MQALKKLLLIITIGHLGLHHVANDQWKKSLPLLISFMIALFGMMGNMFFIRSLKAANQDMPLAELLLHPESFFTWIFLAAFVVNRLLWIWELINWFKSDLLKR